MYEKPNQQLIDNYKKIFDRACTESSLKDCMIGKVSSYRIYSRDSYISTITAPEVFLEYVAFTEYLSGNQSIKQEIFKVIHELALSENPLEFFQSINYLGGEMMLKKVYGELPFEIFDYSLVASLEKRLPMMKEVMVNYKEGDFSKYKDTIYDMAVSILRVMHRILYEKK